MLRGMIIWHYYLDGKLVNSSATTFEGTEDQLQKQIAENYDETLSKGGVGLIGIFHNFVLFSF